MNNKYDESEEEKAYNRKALIVGLIVDALFFLGIYLFVIYKGIL